MNIEQEVEKILQKKGIAPPGISQQQFFEKFSERLKELVPPAIEKTLNQLAQEIIDDEMEKIGRGEPCKFWRPGRPCIISQKEPDCIECTSYKPRSRWRRWVRTPEFLEGVIIGTATLSLVAAILAEEVRFFVLGLWFVIVVISRLHICMLNRSIRKSKLI